MTLLFDSPDWTPEILDRIYEECCIIGRDELKLTWYPNQFEIVSYENMLDVYSSVGMPMMYNHWSFGKSFINNSELYKAGKMGLALELVLNTNPCINYLMDENTATAQALVIAHAAIGHNSFFKNNYLFKQWTSADSIIDYLGFAKKYILDCEEKYGIDEVEQILDAAHALMDHSVDMYVKPKILSPKEELEKQKARDAAHNANYDELWALIPNNKRAKSQDKNRFLPNGPEENLLYFLEKNSPILKSWQREILRIVRKIASYFRPQSQCLAGDNLVSTPNGLIRLDKLILQDGYNAVDNMNLLTEGDKFTPISHTYKRKAKTIKITTKSGKIIIGTPEHPVMSTKLVDYKLHKLGELNTGDSIVIELDYKNIFCKNEYALSEFNYDYSLIKCAFCEMESISIASHVVQKHNILVEDYINDYGKAISDTYRMRRSANYPTKFPKTATPEFAEFIAYILACSKTNVDQKAATFRYTAGMTLMNRFKFLLNDIFGIVVEIKDNSFGSQSIDFNSRGLRDFLHINCPGIIGSAGLVIPKIVYSFPKDSVRGFLKGFFDTNICYRNNGEDRVIKLNGYKTRDTEVFLHFQTLLSAFGVIANIRDAERMTYAGICEFFNIEMTEEENTGPIAYTISLTIHPAFNKQYYNNIGSIFIQLDKENNESMVTFPGTTLFLTQLQNKIRSIRKNKYDELYAKKRQYMELYQTNQLSYDFKVREGLILKAYNYPVVEDIPVPRTTNTTLHHLNKHPEIYNKFYSFIDDYPEIEKIKFMYEKQGVYYDEIISVEDHDEIDVYDVTVPENHLFWTSSMISHNTKIANEGWASTTHYYIMTRLHEKGLIDDGSFLEFLKLHTSVVFQPEYDSKYFSGFNPYHLGFSIFADIKRMSLNPTAEDRYWFPDYAGGDWIENWHYMYQEFRDDGLIQQFLSPKVMRDMKLFSFDNEEGSRFYTISDVGNEQGYKNIRTALAYETSVGYRSADIQITDVDFNTRTCVMTHFTSNGIMLDESSANRTLDYFRELWGFKVVLVTVDRASNFELDRLETD